MTHLYTNQLVSLFHPLRYETVKQELPKQNNAVNSYETIGLKALADKVLRRNVHVNNCETDTVIPVSLNNFKETKETKLDFYYITFFEERAAIAEFDGCQSREEAENIAYKDTLSEWIYNNPRTECLRLDIKSHIKEAKAALLQIGIKLTREVTI